MNAALANQPLSPAECARILARLEADLNAAPRCSRCGRPPVSALTDKPEGGTT